ncbi:MAG: helix-hairpin-helix domain-containing protein [Pseudomonadales bacterium]|jgi:competence protein ComEA|nr:helix-hairpin-helix domain-containing protein [Pseudomonadales bacterium]MDP6472063.1 helix-hairpin-helix domain-containing protein [Pseudomonadales bacterium]MDP6826664.1 helix-hairpin-helix domain-containing protein [Pseudomonadales bacterium]MDP6969975.1 helix-hairpin-helix domain-containing protein [Pseudomonadales bacterium]|tara:strand:+ start:620 stop:904 length:285 start_codon:yes stop_codon:yes gene_type:complete
MQHVTRQLCAYLLAFLLLVPAAYAVPDEERNVNVNRDNAETIAEVLDGVGIRRAEAIVEYRKAYGQFFGLEDLVEVRGIGEQTVATNAERIRFE